MRPLAIAAFFTALAGLGCQGASSRTPTAAPPTAPNGGPPPLATLIETGPLTAGATVMALHELVLTRAADGQVAAALEPVRAAQALGDVYNIEATTLFNTSPCGDCLKVVGLGYDGSGKVLVDLELRHPFALPPLPYTAVSRLDLHAFDVMGYVVTNGPGNPLVFGGNSVVAQPVLANADGYSDLYDGALEPYISTPGVTEHPYRVFFRDDGPGNFAGEHPNGFADLRDPQGHNTMAMGETSQVQYALTLPGGMNELRLGLAIGLSWGQGARGRGAELTQRQNPVYYLPEFHHKAAWTVTGLLTANTLTEGDPNGSATLELRLRDWQRGAAVEPGFEFAVTPRDRVTAASDLAALTVEVPGLIETPIALDPAAPDSGTGLFDDAVWTTDLHNELDAPAGTYYAWVKAVDSLAPAGDAGLDRTLGNFFTVEDFHTGALVPVVVGATTNQPPTATLGPDPAATCTCGTIRFDASGSTDPDAGALTYEWDFEIPSGDPADFVPDTSGPEPFTSHRYCGAQNTFAGVRVCDDGGLCDTVLVPVEVRVGALDPQSPWEVSPIGRIPSQDISNSLDGYNGVPHFFSAYDAGRRFAVAGDHLYVMVNSPLGDVAGPDYTYRQHLLVSADGGQTWTPGAVLDQTWVDPTPEEHDTDIYPWPHVMLLASPDGTVYFMSEQARPDFYTTELRLWSSGDFGAGPWTERYFDAKDPAQKYSLGGAVDPTDPSRVVMTFNCGTTYFYALKTSTGAEGPWTKTDMGSHNSAGGFGGVLLYGPGGRLYHVSARFAQVGNTGAVHVRRSNDHGDTWELALSHEHPESVFAHGQGAIDPNDPTGDSFVYAAAFANSGNIHLFRSTDGARTMHTLQTSLGEGNADQHYPGARFDNSGQLVVSWVTFDGRLQAAQSSDRGGTFGTPVEIAAGDVSAAYIEPLAGTCDFLALTQTGRLNGPIALQVF